MPEVVVQMNASEGFDVTVSLHAEVHKQVLGLFRKTYAKSAVPLTYEYRPGNVWMPVFGFDDELAKIYHEDSDEGSIRKGLFDLLGLGEGLSDKEMREAVSRGGPYSLYIAGLQAGSDAEAERLLTQAATLGEPMALVALGDRLLSAQPDEALQWYEQAFELGEPTGAIKLGDLLLS